MQKHSITPEIQADIDKYLAKAESGDSEAQFELGRIYCEKLKDNHKAIKFFRSSAKQGSIDAKNCLACCYMTGRGVKTNYKKSINIINGVICQNNARTFLLLGDTYRDGLGVEKDLKKAFELYKQAVDQGNRKAFYRLGHCYEYGEGVSVNIRKAAILYKKGAEQGDMFAMATWWLL